MATTTVLSPPLPATSSSRRPFRLAAIVLAVIMVSVAAVGVVRALRDDSTTRHTPAVTTPAPAQVSANDTLARIEAQLATPEGRAAVQKSLAQEFAPGSFGARPGPSTPPDQAALRAQLAHEFAPGSFGARPGPSTPTASSTSVDDCPVAHGVC